jgi:hypothetical protein
VRAAVAIDVAVARAERRGTSNPPLDAAVDVRQDDRLRFEAMPGTAAHTICAIVSPCHIIAIAT